MDSIREVAKECISLWEKEKCQVVNNKFTTSQTAKQIIDKAYSLSDASSRGKFFTLLAIHWLLYRETKEEK